MSAVTGLPVRLLTARPVCGSRGHSTDVDEVRARAGLRDRFGGGDEGVRYGHDGIARLYAGGDQSKAQRVGATSYADATLCLAKLGKLALEGLHHRSTDEARSLQSHLEDRDQFVFEFLVGSHQVHQRNLAVGVHRTSFVASLSDRSGRAG